MALYGVRRRSNRTDSTLSNRCHVLPLGYRLTVNGAGVATRRSEITAAWPSGHVRLFAPQRCRVGVPTQTAAPSRRLEDVLKSYAQRQLPIGLSHATGRRSDCSRCPKRVALPSAAVLSRTLQSSVQIVIAVIARRPLVHSPRVFGMSPGACKSLSLLKVSHHRPKPLGAGCALGCGVPSGQCNKVGPPNSRLQRTACRALARRPSRLARRDAMRRASAVFGHAAR